MTIVRVRIEDQDFEVEVGDVSARPIVARVDGQRFEVWPAAPASNGSAPPAPPQAAPPSREPPAPGRVSAGARALAPLPGVVVAVNAKPGASVSAGQPLVTIEAMKMNNVVYAPVAGRVAAVRVAAGQTVKHRQVLVEFEPG